MSNANPSLKPKSDRIFLTRRPPFYWRATLDHPPLNIFGPKPFRN